MIRKKVLGGIFIAAMVGLARADTSVDIRQRLNQQAGAIAKSRDQVAIDQADALQQPSAPISEQISLPQALYLSVQQGAWDNVKTLLARYETFADADKNLIRYAKAKLAWQEGDYSQSIAGLQQLVEDNPSFVLGRLELGKALFLDHQNKAALRQFSAAQSSLDANDPKQQGVYQTIQIFEQAILKRDEWSGLFSIGYAHGSNLNQTSHKQDCQVFVFGHTQFESCRRTPPPVAASGWHYEANAQRRFSLNGHHGVSVNALAYGDSYPHRQRYSRHYAGLDADYSYKNAKHELTIGPKMERLWYGGKIDHSAYGAEASWQYDMSPRTSFLFDVSHLYQRHQEAPVAARYNGGRTRLSATVWQSVADTWTVSAGLSAVHQAAKDPVLAYNEHTAQLGVYKRFGEDNVHLMVQGFLSKRQYARFDSLLDKHRQDTKLRLIAIVKVPKWQVMGFYPSIVLEYERNKSNVDWLYSYRNTQIGVRLERRW